MAELPAQARSKDRNMTSLIMRKRGGRAVFSPSEETTEKIGMAKKKIKLLWTKAEPCRQRKQGSECDGNAYR